MIRSPRIPSQEWGRPGKRGLTQYCNCLLSHSGERVVASHPRGLETRICQPQSDGEKAASTTSTLPTIDWRYLTQCSNGSIYAGDSQRISKLEMHRAGFRNRAPWAPQEGRLQFWRRRSPREHARQNEGLCRLVLSRQARWSNRPQPMHSESRHSSRPSRSMHRVECIYSAGGFPLSIVDRRQRPPCSYVPGQSYAPTADCSVAGATIGHTGITLDVKTRPRLVRSGHLEESIRGHSQAHSGHLPRSLLAADAVSTVRESFAVSADRDTVAVVDTLALATDRTQASPRRARPSQ